MIFLSKKNLERYVEKYLKDRAYKTYDEELKKWIRLCVEDEIESDIFIKYIIKTINEFQLNGNKI